MKKFEAVYFETPKLRCAIKMSNQPSSLLILESIEEMEALRETLAKTIEYFKMENPRLLENNSG